jgi:hypothetical protein
MKYLLVLLVLFSTNASANQHIDAMRALRADYATVTDKRTFMEYQDRYIKCIDDSFWDVTLSGKINGLKSKEAITQTVIKPCISDLTFILLESMEQFERDMGVKLHEEEWSKFANMIYTNTDGITEKRIRFLFQEGKNELVKSGKWPE